MSVYRAMAVLVTVMLITAMDTRAQELSAAKDGSIRNIDARSMLSDGGQVFLATRSEVYKAVNDKWRSVFALPSGENEINCIGGCCGNVLIGTMRGLYRSQDGGRTWRNVFRTIVPEKSIILSIDVSKHNPEKVMLGTGRGVFLSDDGGSRWRDISGALKNRQVKCIAINQAHVYAGSDDGLYISKDGPYAWERVYVRINGIEEPESEDESAEAEAGEEEPYGGVSCITLKGGRVYAGIGEKVLHSDDLGKSWSVFPADGLVGTINYVLASRKSESLFCATSKGVMEFPDGGKKWIGLYKGTDKSLSVKSATFECEDEKSLWALTDKGLYRLEAAGSIDEGYIDVETNIKSLKILYDSEPPFEDLQQAAMKYNEVGPEKIKDWRNQARLKALVPKVSFGMDNDMSNTYEIYTSATRDYVVAGPDDVSSGWDVSVSWELGDLVWSTDQTSIDVRSRLNTQIRNDILDDLRRAYYERKRLQFELISSPPKDQRLRFEKELRVKELAQAIDDLTGNYLSEHVSQLNKQK